MACKRRPGSNTCGSCGRGLDPFGRCRRRDCPKFRDLWAGDWQQVYLQNLIYVGDVLLVTVTAPGTESGLIWDRSKCRHPDRVRCSGPNGCRVVKEAADSWNETLDARFSKLHRRASARTRRASGPGPLLAAKAIEAQARGVNHLHLVLAYSSLRDRVRADHYVKQLKLLAGAEMFGFIDAAHYDGAGGVRAAAYCSKYVGKSVGESSVRRPAFVGRHLTAQTKITMRALRWRRHLRMRLKVEKIHVRDELPGLIELFTAFPSLELIDQDLPPPLTALAEST